MYQQLAWSITLWVFFFMVLVFRHVFLKSKQHAPYEPIVQKAYRIRKYYFYALVFIMGVATLLSLTHLPYHEPDNVHSDEVKKVTVKGSQFQWDMSQTEFEVGDTVEFAVTSLDVNHGFGLYDENLELVAQVQAMPQYTNKLYYTFEKPGKYQVLCLEYCSTGHHVMIKDIQVKEKGGK